jgi:hypothetical protein
VAMEPAGPSAGRFLHPSGAGTGYGEDFHYAFVGTTCEVELITCFRFYAWVLIGTLKIL